MAQLVEEKLNFASICPKIFLLLQTCLTQSRLGEMFPFFTLVVKLFHPGLVAALRHFALLVEQIKDAELALYQVDARLKMLSLDLVLLRQ